MRRVALLSLHSSPVARLGRPDAGGMNLYVRSLASGLAGAGLSVDVFTRREAGAVPEIVDLEEGVRLVHLAAGPRRRLPKSVLPLHLPELASAFRGFVDREGESYDVLHSHYWLSGLAAMRYHTRTQSRPVFVHMFHTLAKMKEFYLGEPDPEDSMLRFDGERCLIGRADAIIGATESEGDEMSRLYGRTPQQYAVIPPGLDLDLFRPYDRTASRRFLKIDTERVILFVGRPDRMKGADTLLYAVASLPDGLRNQVRVVLLGGAERGARVPHSMRTAGKLGIAALVECRGKVDHRDLPRYYSAADVCAVPSAYESFGMVATEAMACQTPPVAFRVGGLAATIADGRSGFLAEPGSVESYSRALLRALTSPSLEAMGRTARISVQRYSWERSVRDTLALYAGLHAEQVGTRTYASR